MTAPVTASAAAASAEESAGAHARTAGVVLLGMGVVAISGRFLLYDVLGTHPGFIGPTAMSNFGLLYFAVGGWMVWRSQAQKTEPS